MQPISPVWPGYNLDEVTFAKNQPEYNPLPSVKWLDGLVLTRWRLTWRERLTALLRGDVYLAMLTFNQPLQPVKLGVTPRDATGMPKPK